MSAVHDLAKSLNRPTVDQIMGAISADLAFMESEFRTEGQKLSMSDAMPALFKALAPRCFSGAEKDMIDALFEVMAAERAWVWDKEERAGRYCNAVVDFRGESERFVDARVAELAEEGFEV